MDVFADQLASLCAAHPTRAKWVIVPSHAAGRMMGDRLALAGTDWANLRFVTPLDLAVRMGAPFLVERGIDPSEEGLGPALMMRLLIDQRPSGLAPVQQPAHAASLLDLLDEPDPPSTSGTHFGPLADQPQLAIALWTTVRELRMAGVRAKALEAVTLASPAKQNELTALLRAYENFLAAHARGDRAIVFEEARRHQDWCPVQPADCWTEWPGAIWSPLERGLIDALPGERIAPIGSRASGSDLPRRLRTAQVTWTEAPPPRAAISLFHAGGPEAEVEEVFRRILSDAAVTAEAAALDQVEIACASEGYATLIWEKALRHDWPVTLSAGVPATLTRPGRALLALAEWIDDDFAAGRLRRLLQSGDVSLDAGDLSPGRAARLLVNARAAWGRDTYRLALGRLASSARRHAMRDDVPDDERRWRVAQADEADRLAAWIASIIDAFPRPDAHDMVALPDVATAAATFVETHAARASALDHLAAARLGAAIAELRGLGDERCSLAQALRFVRERVEGLSVGADRARPGHLFVSSLRDAGVAGRPHLFVVGLEEGRVFPSAFEDPVLLDDDRIAVHADLPLSTDRVDEAVFAVRSRLATLAAGAGRAMTLSYSCRDLRQFRETYASWLMLEMYRLCTGDMSRSYRDLHDHLGAPVSCVPPSPGTSTSTGRWWLHGVARGDAASGRAAVLDRHPMLTAGVRAEAARASIDFTEFDGYVPAAGPLLDPCQEALVVSPTQLESAAECAFRHFLRRGLKIDAIETGDRDRDVWLDPLMRGSLLHDLYAAFLRRCRDEGRAPEAGRDRAWLEALGQQTLEDLAIEMPPPSIEVGTRETRQFLADLDLFVTGEVEAARAGTPVALEVAFGRAADAGPDAETLSTSTPVVVRAGGLTFRIAGRIDRIDELADGTFEILDYKTGGYWPDKWKGTFAGGRRLQHALYGLAAVELLKQAKISPVVAGAQYYFSSAKGRLERKRIGAQPEATVGRVLADLREVIAGGTFVHTSEPGDCRFCDYGPACGADAHDHAKRKMADPKLAPNRRLADHD